MITTFISRSRWKSTVTAAVTVHEVLYRAPSLVLLLSPSLRQSQELFRKVVEFYRELAGAPPPEAETSLRMELPNGSRIVSLPGRSATLESPARKVSKPS